MIKLPNTYILSPYQQHEPEVYCSETISRCQISVIQVFITDYSTFFPIYYSFYPNLKSLLLKP